MATTGQNSKPYTRETYKELMDKKAATKERKRKASPKQLKSWARFRASGAAGFAQGAVGSAINRLQALRAEFPQQYLDGYDAISKDILLLRQLEVRIRHHLMAVIVAIDSTEEVPNVTDNCSSD